MRSLKPKRTALERRLLLAIRVSGLTITELAERSGVDAAAISRLLAGKRSLTLRSAGKIANALKLELVPKRKRGR